MPFRRTLTRFLLVAMLATVSSHAAFSSEVSSDASAWNQRRLNLIMGKGYTTKKGGQLFRGEYIYTAGPDQAGNIAMTCMNGNFMVVTTTKDVSIDENFREAWMYPKKVKRNPTVTINGEQYEPNSWIYLKKRSIAIPQDRKLARKIYNAAIRGDKIQVKFDNKRDFQLNLPNPNADFANFGADCGMGRNK